MSIPIEPDHPGDQPSGQPSEAGTTPPPSPAVRSAHDVAEYSAFYRSTVPRLTAYLIAGEGASRAEAAECAHEALVQLLRRWREVEHRQAWCRTVARRIYYKRLYSAVESFDDVPATGAPLYRDDHESHKGHEQRDRIVSLLNGHPPPQRRTVALVLEGASVEEITEELAVEPATVRSNLRHATRRLADLLDQRETMEEGEDR